MRGAVPALLLVAVFGAGGCATERRVTTQTVRRDILVVSIVSDRAAAGVAQADRAAVGEALRRVADAGVRHAPVTVAVTRDDALAHRLVSTRAAGQACAERRWRRVLPAGVGSGPAVVILVGGIIPSPLPFRRRAGLTCAGRPPVVLLDRQSAPGVSRAVVLLHELGHAAGLVHREAARSRDGPANVMEEDLASRQPGRATTVRDVTLGPAQVAALAALLDPGGQPPIRRGGQAGG